MDFLLRILSLIAVVAFSGILANRLYSALRRKVDVDPAVLFGVSGLFTLGALGTIFLFVGLVSTAAIPYVAGLILVLALFVPPGPTQLIQSLREIKDSYVQRGPRGSEWAFLGVEKLCEMLVLIGVLAPPDMMEWDSLAYHLAVPKLWLSQGHISYISFIHQSNFPGAFDYLYLLGLTLGFAGAKAFVYCAAKFGGLAIFGLARQLYGRRAAWWAVIAFATVPVVLWLSGTAYIDVPNGLCAGLGIAFAAMYCKTLRREYMWMAAIMLGLATASKYTGLQTIAAVGFMLLIVGLRRKQVAAFLKSAVIVGLVAVAIASPWYIKNVANTGNPVYPFFYSKLGGHNWSAPQAEEYSREQSSFGVARTSSGHLDATQIGHAVLGLAYQPGRYINPGQTTGQGFPVGAVGVVGLCALLAWPFSGRSKAFELFCLGAIGISLLMWFALSQQSRYILSLMIPMSILLGGGVVSLRAGPMLAVIASLQAVYSCCLQYEFLTKDQLPVVLGAQSTADYQSRRITFYEAATAINGIVPKTGRVALYDEVFGYLLGVEYYWANPGHSNEIPYDQMSNGHDYVDAMRKMGFTHVYVNLSPAVHPVELSKAWIDAMGLSGPVKPFSPEMVQKYNLNGFEQHFIPLIADASARGELRVVKAFKTAILFEIVPASSQPAGQTAKQ